MALPETRPASLFGDHFILLHEMDNILICRRSAVAGTAVFIDGERHHLAVDIPLGHKIARASLAIGDAVRRHGIAIGSMTQAVRPGDHVHSHNLVSNYIPAHGRGAAGSQETRS